MRLECLLRESSKDPKMALADFLRTPFARLRYGRATIYTGETYFIPYYRVELASPREGVPFAFLGSALSDDVAVCREDGSLRRAVVECDPALVLEPVKERLGVRREMEKRIKMNRRLRKGFGKCRVDEDSMELVYVPEPSFLVQCRKYRLFLVDPLTEKVDLRHLAPVEERFLASASGASVG